MVSGNRRVLLALLLVAAVAGAKRHHRKTTTLALAPTPPRAAAPVEPDEPSPTAAAPEPVVMQTPPPPRVDGVRERRWGLFGGGLAVFVAGWAIDVGATYGMGHDPAAMSFVPLVGPLIQMSQNWGTVPRMTSGNPQIDMPAHQRIDQVNQAIQTGAYVILAVDFALQLAGVSMTIAGGAGQKVERRYALSPTGLRVTF
jgi:hypothetical protein